MLYNRSEISLNAGHHYVESNSRWRRDLIEVDHCVGSYEAEFKPTPPSGLIATPPSGSVLIAGESGEFEMRMDLRHPDYKTVMISDNLFQGCPMRL